MGEESTRNLLKRACGRKVTDKFATLPTLTSVADGQGCQTPGKVAIPGNPAIHPQDDLVNAPKVSVPKAAKLLGIGQTKLRELIARREIYALPIDGKTMMLERDLNDYLLRIYTRNEAEPEKPKMAEREKHILPDDVIHSEHLK